MARSGGKCGRPLHRRTYSATRVVRFLYASSGTSSAPSPEYVIFGSGGTLPLEALTNGEWETVSSSQRESDSPTTSNPGPIFALDAGTRILNEGIDRSKHCPN